MITIPPSYDIMEGRTFKLSDRELECARCIASGLSDRESKEVLQISKETIQFHMDNIKRKLGTRNRAHTIYMLTKSGIL